LGKQKQKQNKTKQKQSKAKLGGVCGAMLVLLFSSGIKDNKHFFFACNGGGGGGGERPYHPSNSSLALPQHNCLYSFN
jgi:hypothetical protein